MPKPKKPIRPPMPAFQRTALLRAAKSAVDAEPVSIPPSRAGKVLIAGHFAPEVQTALKIAAAEQRTTMQALLAEGINAVFARLGKPQIAEILLLSVAGSQLVERFLASNRNLSF